MVDERVQRRLAAILAADVVAYSRMMEADEEGTLARLKSLRNDVIDPGIAEYGGRIFKTTGDGILAEFPSAVDAVRHAVDVQRAMAGRNADLPEDDRIAFRIGISLGDVMVDGDDLFGNGVNVAARMESLADPGGICISGNVQEHIGNTIDVALEDLGEKPVKNIDRPVRCYRVHLQDDGTAETPAPLSNKPAVAVLPFENMSDDPDQEYFADGLTEDIITELALWRSFAVIARNSTFAYKGKSPDIREVGETLGVRYVVEGSVRRIGNRVRINAQLIDAETGHHVWAERYDRELDDIFALQDEITDRIAAIIEPAIDRTERQHIATKSPNDLAAWELCLKGYSHVYEATERGNEDARELFRRAIERDPLYARAHTALALTYARELRFWRPTDPETCLRLFFESARRSIAIDDTSCEARTMLARAYMFAGRADAAISEARSAVKLNPHDAFANNILGSALSVVAGRFEDGIPWLERAIDLNPLDPRIQIILVHLAIANLGAGNHEKAVECAQDAIRRQPDFLEAHVVLAAALGFLDRSEEARAAIETFTNASDNLVGHSGFYGEATKDCIRDGLGKAGLSG